MKYYYGMRLRGFSMACQPMLGLVNHYNDPTGRYYSILIYDRQLTDSEIQNYELDYIRQTN